MKVYTHKEQIKIMIDYLYLKVQVEDWHAVADAAMDIREMIAKEQAIENQRRADL